MAQWVKKRIKLHALVGVVKDQLSTGRAIAKHTHLTQIDRSVLRATGHEDQAMQEGAVRSVLEIGTASRMRVSHCIRLIMERLNRTSTWVVALKCLILIHRCLLEGGFMFRDQLSVYPAKGGHNYLNLSNFKDNTSPFAWSISVWIRWYARFLEQWIQTAKSTRSFPDIRLDDGSASSKKLCSESSWELVRDVSALYDLLQEVSSLQAEEFVGTHALVKEAIRLVVSVTFSVYGEIKVRLYEAQKRVVALERPEAFVLLHICQKLSTDSMTFTFLLESIKDQFGQHDYVALEHVLLSDYDLMNLKHSFQLASTNNTLSSREQPDLSGKLALPWRSGSWNGVNSGSMEAIKHKGRASLSFPLPPM